MGDNHQDHIPFSEINQPSVAELGADKTFANTKILVVGAGALGCALLQQLAALGVGCIGIADGGKVQYENTDRPVLFAVNDEGELKVKAATAALHRHHPNVATKEYPFLIYNVLALKIIPKYDLVIDCTNHLPTRLLLNDACALLGKPMIFAALNGSEGIVGLLHAKRGSGHCGINYRDVAPSFNARLQSHNSVSTEEVQVFTGMLGTLQALAVSHWIKQSGLFFDNEIIRYNMETLTPNVVQVEQDATQKAPKDESDFLHTNYEWLCGADEVREISMRELQQKMQDDVRFIDVREMHETPDLPVPHQRIPLSRLQQERVSVEGEEVIVVCHMGVRSVEAVQLLSQWAAPGQKLYSLKGGIMALAAVVNDRTH
ncbi:ThiF family adenylyltransferase [Pseudocnuella soli]|uniref:ThiF family adenylyltransferase n=1 Tax=Pseudocnuella soli TaxID=2502779 RepID=UPI00104BBE4C|nr:ThiF family adenylyltransferase [Pseudocnuella soli]